MKSFKEEPKIVSALLEDALQVPGTSISGDFTLNEKKQVGIKLNIDPSISCLVVTQRGITAYVPLARVKVMVLG